MARYLRSEEMVVFERIVRNAMFDHYEYFETKLGPIYIAWKERGDGYDGIWGTAGVARMYESAPEMELDMAKREMFEDAYSFLFEAGNCGLLEDTHKPRYGANGS